MYCGGVCIWCTIVVVILNPSTTHTTPRTPNPPTTQARDARDQWAAKLTQLESDIAQLTTMSSSMVETEEAAAAQLQKQVAEAESKKLALEATTQGLKETKERLEEELTSLQSLLTKVCFGGGWVGTCVQCVFWGWGMCGHGCHQVCVCVMWYVNMDAWTCCGNRIYTFTV